MFDEIGKEAERRSEHKAHSTGGKEVTERGKISEPVSDEDDGIMEADNSGENTSQIQEYIRGMVGNSKGQQKVSSLNNSQHDALIMCLKDVERRNEINGGISLVQGPPGCGKTHFLVALMHVLLSRGHKLIVSRLVLLRIRAISIILTSP